MKITLAGLALLIASPAFAQDRPPLAPTRDVTVDYVVDAIPPGMAAGVKPGTRARLEIKAGGMQVRVEPADIPGVFLLDRATGRLHMLLPQQRMMVDLPVDTARLQVLTLTDKMNFTRQGTDTVAGLRCTDWDIVDGSRHSNACITADGVLLRGQTTENGGPAGVSATSVRYGALPEALFAAPAGFTKLDLPGGAFPGLRR